SQSDESPPTPSRSGQPPPSAPCPPRSSPASSRSTISPQSSPRSSPICCPSLRAQRATLLGSFSSRSPKLEGSARSSSCASSLLSWNTRETSRDRLFEPQYEHVGVAPVAAENV